MVSALVYDSRCDDDAQQLAPRGRYSPSVGSGTKAWRSSSACIASKACDVVHPEPGCGPHGSDTRLGTRVNASDSY